MGIKKDVILLDKLDEIYPLAHSDSNGEIIPDTYFRKNVHYFTINSDNWQPVDDYFVYEITEEIDERVKDVKETDKPLWDIVVDPSDPEIVSDYKTQIKYRAWCTTLLTFNGSLKLISMNQPEEPITLMVIGLKLKERQEEENGEGTKT